MKERSSRLSLNSTGSVAFEEECPNGASLNRQEGTTLLRRLTVTVGTVDLPSPLGSNFPIESRRQVTGIDRKRSMPLCWHSFESAERRGGCQRRRRCVNG